MQHWHSAALEKIEKMADAANSLMEISVASKVPFAEMCGLLEKVSKTQGNDKKKRILKDFTEKWRESHNTLHGDKKDVVSEVNRSILLTSIIVLMVQF